MVGLHASTAGRKRQSQSTMRGAKIGYKERTNPATTRDSLQPQTRMLTKTLT